MDFAASLSADLSAALAVDVVENRPETGERHLCVRPVAAEKVESVNNEIQGPDENIQYDWFQKTAFACVERSDSVLVAAPTSAGKTAVALYAIRRCMAAGRRCVYTAPIKALSNEKFCDFVREFSAENVALLTGDARAGRLETAKIVVMTTEVLVSLLHNEAMLDEDVEDVSSRSALMQSLSCAVFDEIHYIADEERGTAWEECIVLLERHVQLIGLSATVPNFLHLAAWMAQTRHARCHGIFSRRRPVPLVHGVVPCPPAKLVEVTTTQRRFKFKVYQDAVKSLPKPGARAEEGDRGKELVKIVQACREKKQLPLIVFSFSRKESAKMARELAPSVKLTEGARRKMEDQLEMVLTKQLQEEDRQLQSIRECQFLLSRGVGLHHGGLLPVLREITEKFFKEGLIRVLCTTETFAVGVNMPSRSIVFNWPSTNEFQKFDGSEQRDIFVAEYMQMAGRAGRRGKDKLGNVWNIVTRKHPAPLVRKYTISQKIEPVESKFCLSWPLILRCLRSGGGVLSVMSMQNFKQFLTGSASHSVFEEECQQKLEALSSQGYVEESHQLTPKGRAAAFLQVATPALLSYRILEMPKQLFRDSIMNYLVAFLTCFVNDLEEPEEVETEDAFEVFWEWSEDELQKMEDVLKSCDQCTSGMLLNQLRRRATFFSATLKWMKGASFEECSDAAGGPEYDGILARVLRKTHLMLKQLGLAFQLLNDPSADSFCKAHQTLHRGGSARQSLPFLESLYLPLSFEPDTLDPAFLRQQEKPCPYRVGDVVQMSPADIGFSHFSISAHFRDGNTIASTLRQLIRREIRKEDIETVQVYWTENKFWCLSNRRLAVFRLYQQMCPEDGATIPVEVVGDERAREWNFWRLWTTGLWRGRRAVLRATSEMVGRTAEETYFFSLDGESPSPEEPSNQTGYERAEHPPDMPGMDEEMNAEESEDVGNGEGREGAGDLDAADAEILEMEDFSVAVDSRQVATFLINRELDEANPASQKAMSQPCSSYDLLPAPVNWDVNVNTPIPDKFKNIHEYLRSFALPMLEELREELKASLDCNQLNLDEEKVEQVRLVNFEDREKLDLKQVPPIPLWFRKVGNSQIMVVLNARGGPSRAARWAPGQMCLLYEEGSVEQVRAIGDRLTESPVNAAPATLRVQEGGCYRFGLLHTTPKSKHALLLVTQRCDLPSCTANHEITLTYDDVEEAAADLTLSPWGEDFKIDFVTQGGMAWEHHVRPGMKVCYLDGWDGTDDMEQADLSEDEKVTVVVQGDQRRWRLAMLQCNVMSILRIATALAQPNQHHPVFWQKEISGNPDAESSVFGRMRETQCAAMRSVEDLAQMGLNESQANAVSSLVQCRHGVRLVQGPPGTGKTHTLSVLLQECSRLALSIEESSIEEVASDTLPVRKKQEELEKQRQAAIRRRHANRCLVCAPTNIAVYEVLSRMLEKLDSKTMRAQVALVATEDRAGVTFGDEISAASSVLLDHRKKRIKRMARFWLGEGFERGKPHLRQPPWAWKAQSAMANLIEDLPRAYEKELGSRAIWRASELISFLQERLQSLHGKLESQKHGLSEEVALDMEDFPPSFTTKQDQNRLEMEALICEQLREFRRCLQSLSSSLQQLLHDWEPSDKLQTFSVKPPTPLSQGPEVGTTPASNQFSEADRRRAYRCVSWTEDLGCLQELAEMLKLPLGPLDEAGLAETLAGAKKKLSLLVHPDKAPTDLKQMATCAFQNLDQAMEGIRRYLHLPNPPAGTSSRSRSSRSRGKVKMTAKVVEVHEMLKECLSEKTLEALKVVLADHAELCSACNMVRTATSTNLKSMLLRRCSVVFCTLTVAGRLTISAQQFPTLLVDEACQACEAETLTALRTTVQRMFLVGDPRQLPATIASPNAKRAGYGRSMFERLELLEMEKSLLDVQYRMEEPILSWSNESFYEQKIKTATCVLERPDCADERLLFELHPREQHRVGPFRLFDTSNQKTWVEEQVRFSFQNRGEAQFVLDLLRYFFTLCRPESEMTIGIVTPYRAQVELLDSLLDASGLRSLPITVATVDGFQGNERDIIIISTVRSGGGIGFNADERRLNVAVTRAKHRAWIVGNMDTLYGGRSEGNVWRGLLAFAKLRGWVLPASPTAAASPTPPPQPQRRLPELTGPQTELMRVEWEEQKAIGYMVERFFEGWWQPFCLLCNRFIDGHDGHLESNQHRENKKTPLQLMALAQPQDEGFLVSLQLSGSETGFSLEQISSHGQLQVDHIEEGSWLDDWNDQVALQDCQLSWAPDVPMVLPGSRILEVEGLVGAQAVAAQLQAQHKLRMTVALPRPEEEEPLPPPVSPVPCPLPPIPVSPAASLPLGGPGFRWEALWNGIKGKEGQRTDTQEVCLLNSGDVVVQAWAWERLSNGLIRMPIRPTKNCPHDFRQEVWVTLDARNAGAGGKVFFKPFEHFGCTGSLWRCSLNGVKIRSSPELTSDICGEIRLNNVVIQAMKCEWEGEVLRLPIQGGNGRVGWVTLDARFKGGPLLFDFMGPLEGGLWQAVTAVYPRARCSLDSPVVQPAIRPGEIVFQQGPWNKLADGKLQMPIQWAQGRAWVMLLSDASDDAAFELVGMDGNFLNQSGYADA